MWTGASGDYRWGELGGGVVWTGASGDYRWGK